MIPGGRMNERQMRMMMKRAGINTEEISEVEEVLIRTRTKEYLFKKAEVSVINAQGQTIYQVIGKPEVFKKGECPSVSKSIDSKSGPIISDEDIELVAEKAGVNSEEARKALEECDGQPAEAIIKLMSRA